MLAAWLLGSCLLTFFTWAALLDPWTRHDVTWWRWLAVIAVFAVTYPLGWPLLVFG